MDIREKYILIERLMMTEDEQLLNQVKELLGITDKDWWGEISQAEKEAIQKGIEDLDNGNGIPHEEVMQRVKERFFNNQ